MPTDALPTKELSAFDCKEYKRLNEVLATPEQLAFFQKYLQNIHAHETLLFIEALTELEHAGSSSNLEYIVHRIWRNFLANDAPLELNIKDKESIKKNIDQYKWSIISKTDALYIFKEAEMEVKVFLNEKVQEFDDIYHPTELISQHNSVYNEYQKRVVIIGGGFTGFAVASILDPMPRFHVTLIDAKDSFEFTPGVIKLLVRPEETSCLRVSHNAYVKKGRVIIGYADRIVDDATHVKVNNEYIPFDYLVIATGSTYQSNMKSFDISGLYRLAKLTKEHNQLKEAESVLIIGGGLVGCELASEIGSHMSNKRVTLVESNTVLLHRSNKKQQKHALDYIKGLGVQVVLNERIVDFDSAENNTFLGSSGARYSGYDKVFLATGTTPCSGLLQGDGDVGFESCVDHWGRIRVKPTLQLDHWKYHHIFAGGDVSNIQEEKTGYSATLAGVCIARNICRIEKGKAPLKQGTHGTPPAPLKPLYGLGGPRLGRLKRVLAPFSSSWTALKCFDGKEFMRLVQGDTKFSTTAAIGRIPRILYLPYNSSLINKPHSKQQQTSVMLAPCHKRTTSTVTEIPLEVSKASLSGLDIIETNNSIHSSNGKPF